MSLYNAMLSIFSEVHTSFLFEFLILHHFLFIFLHSSLCHKQWNNCIFYRNTWSAECLPWRVHILWNKHPIKRKRNGDKNYTFTLKENWLRLLLQKKNVRLNTVDFVKTCMQIIIVIELLTVSISTRSIKRSI